MPKTNYIVINGKKYNAKTGEMLRDSADHKSPVETVTHRSMDGVSRPKYTGQRSTAKHAQKPVQKSTTLMRKSVKKPLAPQHKPSTVAGVTKSTLGVHPTRIANANSIHRSPQINKYGSIDHRTSVRKAKIAELPVKGQPEHQQQQQITQKTEQQQSSHARQSKNAARALIESALQNAQSHTEQLHPDQAPKKKRLHHKLGISKKVMNVGAGSLAALLLIGFFAVQNIPNLSMRVAAARSGVNSNMPGYTPSGFSFKGPIDYSNGVVTVSFKSNSDERSFTVTQQNSAWTSDSLLSEYVTANSKQYQTYLDGRGRTLYVYDKDNATWVQDGIWYRVEGESDLTTDQLARLAASM